MKAAISSLDTPTHQANDFHINKAFWAHINELTAEYNEDGTFVTFPEYEWSGNTAVGGDRNVYFRTEGRQIHRSSYALIPDRSDIATDSPNANQLFNDLQDEDCVVYAHVGGRYADISYAHDPRLETAMEIHSAWGTFEWLLTDGLERITQAAGLTQNPHILPIILFAIETGMRRGEILGLERQHVHLDRQIVFLPMTKNGLSREVPLTQKAKSILDAQNTLDIPSPFPVTANALRMAWDRLLRRADISGLRFHDLRHEAITELINITL